MSIFSRLSDGPLAHSLVERVDRIHWNLLRHKEEALELAANPRCADLLPSFGYALKAAPTGYGEQAPFGRVVWQEEDHMRTVLYKSWRSAVKEAVVHHGQPDGTVRQRVSGAKLEEAWGTVLDQCYRFAAASRRPDPSILPLLTAEALAALPGWGEWTIVDGVPGGAVERVLPAWPARVPPTTHPLKMELGNGLLCETVAWAVLTSRMSGESYGEVLMISLVGQQKKIKAVWAALMDNKRHVLKLPSLRTAGRLEVRYGEARRLAGKGRYQTFWNREPLHESGLAHVVIEARESLSPRPGVPFAHITGSDGTPDWGRLFRQMDLALRLPIREEWMRTLWEEGQEANLIVALPAHGCSAFWVRAGNDEGWAKVIARAAGASGPDAGRMETFGSASHKAEVAEEEEEVEG
jgi:hypothetical protein